MTTIEAKILENNDLELVFSNQKITETYTAQDIESELKSKGYCDCGLFGFIQTRDYYFNSEGFALEEGETKEDVENFLGEGDYIVLGSSPGDDTAHKSLFSIFRDYVDADKFEKIRKELEDIELIDIITEAYNKMCPNTEDGEYYIDDILIYHVSKGLWSNDQLTPEDILDDTEQALYYELRNEDNISLADFCDSHNIDINERAIDALLDYELKQDQITQNLNRQEQEYYQDENSYIKAP